MSICVDSWLSLNFSTANAGRRVAQCIHFDELAANFQVVFQREARRTRCRAIKPRPEPAAFRPRARAEPRCAAGGRHCAGGGSPRSPRSGRSPRSPPSTERDFSSFIIGEGVVQGAVHFHDQVAQHGVVELEGMLQFVERDLVALDVHEHVVRLVHFLDRVGHLPPAPVLQAVQLAAAGGDAWCGSARSWPGPVHFGPDEQ